MPEKFLSSNAGPGLKTPDEIVAINREFIYFRGEILG
jgi:hypothetical protein